MFGKEYHIDSKYKGLPIVSTIAIDQNKDQIIETKVELQFIQNDGKKLQVIRSAHFKEKNKEIVEVPTPHVAPCVMRQTDREWVGPIYGEDAQYIIDNMVPPTIEAYFFFDGERMDDYFKENTGREIKDAVFQISQLELFEKHR